MNDTASPLSFLRDSFVPRLGASKLGRKSKRSISVKTAWEDDTRPPTPGGILDGYLSANSQQTFGAESTGTRGVEMSDERAMQGYGRESEQTRFPSVGESGPRRFFGKILGEGELQPFVSA